MGFLVSNEALYAVDVITGCVSVVFALTRLFTHFQRRPEKRTWPDALGTFFLLLSAAFAVPLVVLSRVDAYKTIKHDAQPLEPGELPYEAQVGPAVNHYIQILLQLFALWAIRLSYLVTFWAFRPTVTTAIKHGLSITTAILIGAGFGTILTTLFWCHPIDLNWVVVLPGQPNCDLFSPTPLSIVFGFALVSDLTIIIYSIFLLQGLNLKTTREFAVFSLVLSIGALSLFATIGRYVIMYKLETGELEGPGTEAWFNITTKMEVIFATTAYGLTTARTFVRILISTIKELTSGPESRRMKRRSSFNSSNNSLYTKKIEVLTLEGEFLSSPLRMRAEEWV